MNARLGLLYGIRLAKGGNTKGSYSPDRFCSFGVLCRRERLLRAEQLAQARGNSDVDLLVEFDRPVGLFEFARLKLYLEQVLGHTVDWSRPRRSVKNCGA